MAEVENPGAQAAQELGLTHRVIRYGEVDSAQEAAHDFGLSAFSGTKSLLVRRGEGDHLLVLVPGNRSISWPKLRAVLGVSRLSMPDAEAAFTITGYRRGTITPLGLSLPVVMDERLVGTSIRLGSGAPGVAIGVLADDIAAAYQATVADVTD